jgi:5-methylcytosine-specific restriction endonuclease McrA
MMTPKEKNLLKGAFRRVFARSELRAKALNKTRIEHSDINRPRVTKWSYCESCGIVFPTYQATVDHIEPVVPLDSSFEQMDLNSLGVAMWCDESNLQVLDDSCHKIKSKLENKQRREHKKAKEIANGTYVEKKKKSKRKKS